MKNDPIINAKASKIVEAIVPVIKEQLLKQMHPMVHQNDYPSQAVPLAVVVDMMPLVRQPLTEALSSIGGEEPNKIDLSEVSVFELQRIMRETPIVYTAPPHPSEREVLVEYEMIGIRNIPKDEWKDFPNIMEHSYFRVNRYLAEKQMKSKDLNENT